MTKGQEIATECGLGANGCCAQFIDMAIREALTERTRECDRIVKGWRETDWPEGFDRYTAELLVAYYSHAILAVDKPKPPVWCEHIIWSVNLEHWIANSPERLSADFDITNDFEFCPVCRKPRPS